MSPMLSPILTIIQYIFQTLLIYKANILHAKLHAKVIYFILDNQWTTKFGL